MGRPDAGPRRAVVGGRDKAGGRGAHREDATAMVGCPTCKVLVDQEVHLLSDYCDRGMAWSAKCEAPTWQTCVDARVMAW